MYNTNFSFLSILCRHHRADHKGPSVNKISNSLSLNLEIYPNKTVYLCFPLSTDLLQGVDPATEQGSDPGYQCP